MPPGSLGIACGCAFLLVAAHPADSAPQTLATASIIGTWRGTSTCVDKATFPACHDEEVVYEVRTAPQSPDSVVVRADRVVGGAREFMGELVFGPTPRGEWSSVLQTPNYRGRWTLRVESSRMTGTLIDLPGGRQVRAVTLLRATQ